MSTSSSPTFRCPDLPGWQRTNSRSLRPETPYIFFSGTIGEINAMQALQRGATDYIIKDRPGRLISAVHRAIDHARERRDRTQVEQNLREIQQQFFQLAERSSDVFWISQIEPPTMLYVSPAYERVCGRPVASIREHPSAWEESIHQDDRQRIHTAITAVRTGAKSAFDEEYRIIRPDGSERWILGSAVLLQDPAGGSARISGIAKDITERKQAARHIREQAEYLAKARDAIVVKNLSHQIVCWNQGAERILGWTAAEATGRIGSELFGARLLQRIEPVADTNADAIERGQALWFVVSEKNGNEKRDTYRVVTAIMSEDLVPAKQRIRICCPPLARRRFRQENSHSWRRHGAENYGSASPTRCLPQTTKPDPVRSAPLPAATQPITLPQIPYVPVLHPELLHFLAQIHLFCLSISILTASK
ncbi:MAG TPA: PAS domain S-box protein [Candidatus Didemnitutus sp.]|nr:PAS domain S-box protein [Candidatus Didemnitutus sp.]